MIVKFKEKILRIEEDSTIEDFKHENLKREKLLIKNLFMKITQYTKGCSLNIVYIHLK